MFDLNTAFAVRERDDGLLERDTFDLSSATPLETPIEQPKPNWELLKDPSFKADFEVVKQSAIGQLQDVYTILGAPLKIALGMQVDPLKEFPKIVDYLTQPRSVPPLTSANIKGVLTGKGIVETTEGVPGDISILDGLFLAWGGQQALKGFTGAIQYNKAIDKMIATEEIKTAEEAVAYNIAQDLPKYEKMFAEGGEFPAGVDNDTKVRVIMNNLDNNPQLKTEVFADTALRIKGIDPNTIIETTAEAEGLQPSNLLNKLKRINELVGERGSVIIPKAGQNVSYEGKPGKIIKVEGKLAEVQFLGEKTTAIVALNQLQVPKVEANPEEALYAEARKYKSAEEFVNKPDLNEFLKWRIPEINKIEGNYVYTKDGNKIELLVSDFGENVEIRHIEAEKKGTGIGTKLVQAVNDYADLRFKNLAVHKPYNEPFWKKMGVDIRDGTYGVKRDIDVKNAKDIKTQLTDIWNKANGPAAGGKVYNLDPQTLAQIKKMNPDITKGVTLNQDITVKDIFGNTKTYKKGESIFIYEDSKTGKAIVKDGDYGVLQGGQVDKVEQAGSAWGESPEESQIEEVVKGMPQGNEEKINQLNEEIVDLQEAGRARYAKVKDVNDWGYQNIIRQVNEKQSQVDALKEPNTTKFSQYTLPGGENYKEILFKAPSNIPENLSIKKLPSQNFYYVERKLPNGMTEVAQSGFDTEQDAKNWISGEGGFRSSHWDESNVLSHARVNDRTTPDGKRVLFIEEIQSDWARKGREVGFRGNIQKEDLEAKWHEPEIPEGHDPKNYPGYWEIYNKENGELIIRNPGNENINQKQEAIDEAFKTWVPSIEEGRPSFHPALKSWQSLALKRLLNYAVKNGYDGIAWTTGEQQAERYDLSKQINSVHYVKQKDGQVAIKAYPINDNGLNTIKKTVPENEVANVVGKDLAEKIKNGPNEGMFSGMDLRVGGEWAKNLYDKQIPNILKDLTKGEVKNTDLNIKTKYGDTAGITNTQPALMFTPEVKTRIIGQPAGGGLPEKPIHINNLNITPAAKQHLEATIESIKPELEEIKGDTLTYDEILEAAKTSEILTSATSRAATKAFEAKLLRTRQHLAALAEQKGISPEFIDALKAVRAAATDLARGLGSLNIEAQGEEYTLKTRIVNELTDMGVQMEEIIQAAEGVDFTNQEQVTKFYRQFVKPKLWDLLNEYRYINLLSSPKTHIVNAFSNLLQVSGLAPGTKLFMGDVKGAKAFYVGAFNAVGDAWVKAWDALKGKTFVERPDVKHIPTGNKLLKPLRYIPQALEASDVFFRTIAYEGELAAQLGKGANQKDAENLAKEKASYFVFRKALDPANKTGQGHLLSAIDHLTSLAYKARSIPILGRVIGWYIPFVQTPMNIAKQMIEYSPAGFTTLPGAKDKKEQLAKALLGSFIFGLAAYLVSKNDTTWSVPTSKKEKDLFFAAGRQPFSIKLGNTWIGYSRLGPLAFPIAIPAAIKHYTQNNPKSVTDNTIQKTSKVIGGLGEFFASMSYMEGIGSLMDLVKNAPGAAAKFAVEAPSQFIAVSSLQRWVNNYIIDPIYRKTDKEISAEAIVYNARKSIIFATKGLPAYETPEGEKSRRSYPGLNAFSPIPVSKSNKVYEAEYKQYIETRKEDILNKQDTTEEAVRKPRRR